MQSQTRFEELPVPLRLRRMQTCLLQTDASVAIGTLAQEAIAMANTARAAMTALLALTGAAAAENWPSRPITLVVPFAAGGGVDVSVRIQAQHMSELLGQPIVVDNVGAAAGTVGSQRVAKAAPDGYTMLVGNTGTHAYSQSLYRKPPYNSVTDFQPVGLVSESPRILIAR